MIKLIIQCADIHIRRMQRMDEYAEQLERFIDKCNELMEGYEKDEVRILICGDVVHQRTDITNELIIFVSSFIRRLSEIAKVVIYSGNHDLLVNNQSRIDTLTGIFETAQFDNAVYLDSLLDYKSGCVNDDNITWALYSIHDNYKKPDIERIDGNTVVGLYHGVLVGAQLNNGTVMENGVEADIFEDCDCVMAGDIHKVQEIRRGDVDIVYSGSLIQQNFGETVTQHGFYVWDIEHGTHQFIELESDYGLYDFEIKSETDIDNDNEFLINY